MWSVFLYRLVHTPAHDIFSYGAGKQPMSLVYAGKRHTDAIPPALEKQADQLRHNFLGPPMNTLHFWVAIGPFPLAFLGQTACHICSRHLTIFVDHIG